MTSSRHERIITSPDNPVQIYWERQCTPDAYPLAWHEEMEIQLIKEGAGCYFIEGAVVPFREKSVIIIQPREIHRRLQYPDRRVGKWCIMFNVKNMTRSKTFLKNMAELKRYCELTTAESENMDHIIRTIREEINNRKTCWKALLNTLLMELLLRIKRSEANIPACRMHPSVNRALDYIERHYTSSFNVSALADSLNISERHLARLFLADIGIPIKHFVLQKRVLHAQHMIRSNPALKLEAVSEASGFKNYSLFHRMFKILTGVPPNSYV